MAFNPMIAKLHIAKKQLGLDDASYRALLVSATGKSSAKDMREAELVAALDAMKRAGFKTLPPKTPEQKQAARKPYVTKIYALWGDLERSGALTDPSLNALQSFVKRQTGISRVEWLGPEEANKVTEGLKAWLGRVRRDAATRETVARETIAKETIE